jgi:hypothetical protein
VAADLAFDAVEKTYRPSEVVLLQYHLHIPGPDPLTNKDTEARQMYYDEQIEGTPTAFFNGKPAAPGGGGLEDAQGKYKEYRAVIDPLLETSAKAKVQANAVRKGNRIDISAEVTDVEQQGDKVRLRLALVEDQVRYTGGNNLRFHHRVVRAMPGGVEGLALKEKSGKQSVTVNLDELRKSLSAYLDAYAERKSFPNDQRPMDFKNLSVVAFVQNDETKEILQAVQVEVRVD